jgi:hypothetical protein
MTLMSTGVPTAGAVPFKTVTVKVCVVPTGLVADCGEMAQLGCALVQVLAALHEKCIPFTTPIASIVSVPGPPVPV